MLEPNANEFQAITILNKLVACERRIALVNSASIPTKVLLISHRLMRWRMALTIGLTPAETFGGHFTESLDLGSLGNQSCLLLDSDRTSIDSPNVQFVNELLLLNEADNVSRYR